MKFNCGPTRAERRARIEKRAAEEESFLSAWHDHFALVPRRVGSGDCRWLETIERKGKLIPSNWEHSIVLGTEWVWEYRAKRPLSSEFLGSISDEI